MPVTLTPGRTLTPGDLYIVTRDEAGNPVAPYYITYTLFATGSGSPVLMSNPRLVPQVSGAGYYFVNMTIPGSWAEGSYQVVWYMKQTVDSDEVTVTEDFAVQPVKPGINLQAPSVLMASTPATTANIANVIMSVRELLSDTNPDRNYHFRPPTSARVIAGYTSRVGFIWEDVTIIRMLKVAIARINTANPKNFYGHTLESISTAEGEVYAECAAMGAAYLCLTAEGCRWTADEFGYSLNGVSLDLQKGQNYLSLGAQYKTAFDEWLTPLTANRPRSMGVRQYKWLR